ncbi:hypothetical protein COOONC_14313, partial [Cooperia oncophora]
LKFENAPFPSITLCNLNPYKKSAINLNPETKAMIDAYSKRISAGDKSEGIAAALASHFHSRGTPCSYPTFAFFLFELPILHL